MLTPVRSRLPPFGAPAGGLPPDLVDVRYSPPGPVEGDSGGCRRLDRLTHRRWVQTDYRLGRQGSRLVVGNLSLGNARRRQGCRRLQVHRGQQSKPEENLQLILVAALLHEYWQHMKCPNTL